MRTTIEAGTPAGNDARFCDWLRTYDIEPSNTFRVDVYGNGQMWVHQFATRDGVKYVIREDADYEGAWNSAVGEVARREPFEVQVKEFPVVEAVPSLLGFTSIGALQMKP